MLVKEKNPKENRIPGPYLFDINPFEEEDKKQEVIENAVKGEINFIPRFYVMVGLVGSGKSYRANELKQVFETVDQSWGLNTKTVIISSDEIREELTGDANCQTRNDEVFSVLHRRIKDNIALKNNVIVDATNLSSKNRTALLNCVKKHKCYKVAYVMTTPIEICKKQNKQRDRVVPEEVIDVMIRRFQIPFYEEGWDDIVLDNYNEFDMTCYKTGWNLKEDDIFKKMIGFNQNNNHHKYPLDDHCWRAGIWVSKRYWNDKPMCRAATIHDIGKLYTGELKDDGSCNYSYKGHMNYGTYVLLQNLDKLGFNNKEDILNCLFYVNYHMEPFFWLSTLADGSQIIKDTTEKKMRERYGDYKYDALIYFNYCDKLASGTERVNMKEPPNPFSPNYQKQKEQERQEKFKNTVKKKKDYGPVVTVRNKYGQLITKPFKLLSKKQKKKVKKEARLKRKAERRALQKAEQAQDSQDSKEN